ncbi:MAG: methylenetetrahydrofolate reductase [Trueperaceae bacterium]|nr:methylenetetrahydrofolate reductase [Trueperaceae bacterium]
MRVSVELIPRNEADLDVQLDELTELPTVDTVNVPDILRFPLRSWDACGRASERGLRAVPHLRAIDVDPQGPLPFAAGLDRYGLEEVLVVAGDAPADMSKPVYDTTSEALIRRLKRERPQLVVYAALDPYRQGFAAERDYLLRKLDAGADGVFTQPFFDVRLLGVWADLLDRLDTTVFWGATSVTSARSARYWTTRNRAVLPARFAPTLKHSREIAGELLSFARDRDENVYFMPIRVSCRAYLKGLV